MNLNYYIIRSIALFQKGKFSDSIDALKEIQKYQPDNAQIRELINLAQEKTYLTSLKDQSMV